ncbi:potassium channel family protein [Actinophytocola sp.]|uniref:potassium channel family protein n=1 Tax=Actinophytocola sp. TaxID=1872138 RepID=UPI002D7F32C0|nr:potassium channel family protein [Actinophytocola sp.]HET9139333.1 potassium channel family protein [Actinophytocola sp.]HEU5109872.1 potassium channel family protein [Micromonosporaceae bacterium]
MNRRRIRPVKRQVDRFLTEPATIRRAMAVIISAMTVTVVAGGLLVWIFDPKDYPHFGLGMWWALQTVTTVGYGDVTPTTPLGRVVGAVIMLEAVAFMSVFTALIATSFVERARAEHAALDPELSRLAEIADRLERIERVLGIQDEDDPER